MKKNYKQPLLGVMFALGIFSVSKVHSQVDLTATGGTTTATYTTVSAAFAAVNAGTHTGTISISITGNTTEPAAPVALSANGVGTASFASLAIKPTVAAIISGAPGAGSGVLNFSGSDNVTIDGSIAPGGTTKDLTIQNTNVASFTNTAVIRLIGQTTAGTGLGLSNFVIKNNILIGNTPGNNGTSGSSVSSSYGIYAGANNATTMPSGTSGADYDNVLVENNDIKKAYIGINFYGAAANQNDNLIIRKNTIGSTTAADQIGYKGIIAYNTLIGSISNNTISNIQLNTSVSTAGIEVGGTSDNVKISSNVIRSIYSTSTSGYGSYGINIEGGNNYIVDNNSISDIKTLNYSATSQTYNAFGIRLNGGTGHKIYYNSVHLSGNYSTGSTVAASAALAVASTSVTGLDIRNNIFSNVMTSTATGAKEFSAVWFASGYNFTNASLNNNYYGITNDAIHLVGKIGTTSGTGNYLNLNTWRAISQVNNTTNDVNSAPISNTPAPFTSTTNLLPLTTVPTAIESGALAIASLGAPNLDITGATRPGTGTNPDMGAYEFSGMTITCLQPLSITVQSATNTNANVTWTSAGSETSWQLQYGPQGFALGSGTTVLTTTNPGTISGLTTHSFYQVYVRAICGAGDTSLWTGPATFNTYNQAPFMEWRSNCPTPGFINIATTGTDLNLTDDGEQGMTLPFPILYQGTLVTTCTIGNNGGMALGTTSAEVVPSPGNMNSLAGSFIYPWGDDLDDETGNVYQQTIGTAPNRTFIVQWDNICNFSGSLTAPTVTFQVQIDEATGKIWFVYNDVVFGAPNAADDYGANADIGISGPIQDFNVSNDNATYLQNNSCVEFFYTDCPKPKNVVTTFLSAEEITFGWTAGLAAETAWIIEYGPSGFTPGTGTIINTTNSFATITGLTQVTNYALYIYAHCANGDTSLALNHNFTTLPRCSNPTTLGGTAAPDSLKLTWAWTPSSVVYPAQSFKIQYGMTGFPLYSVPTVTANGTNLADTIYDANLMASGVYQYYVQAVCAGGDTSGFAGPFTIRMPLTNDLVCAPELLQLDRTYTFNNAGATVSTGEASIAPPATGAQTTTGWANSTLDGTLWYTFVAPPSGSVRVNATAINYNGQAAVYAVANCANFSTFTLKAANDDAIGGGSSAPNFTVCGLTPGTTYYIMYDKYSSTSGNFSLNVSPIVLEAGIINPASQITNVCTGDTVNLFNTIINYNTGGTWSSSIPAVNVSLQDSLFISSGLAYQTFNLQYRVTEGCAYDSIVSQVRIFKPSNAGQDGIVMACKNEPIDLLAGLNGNTDLNGDWYDTQNIIMPNSQITTANFQGQYNYDYVSGNGVCPNDTAMVIVSVQNCNWLSVEENALEEVSIYPNPSTGLVYVESTFATGSFNLTVTDINGRTIQTGTKSISLGTNAIDLKEVERGTYLFKLSSDSAEKVFRIVIQ